MAKENIDEIIKPFQQMGGLFHSSSSEVEKRLRGIKAFVFDWDGVFNNGAKGVGVHSSFTEADSMGTNLLRFSHWLRTGELPVAAIISGANNETARYFGQREHFHAVYSGYKHKPEALDHLCDKLGIVPSEVCFFFDDVLDLSLARQVGLRMLIGRESSPLFNQFVGQQGWADYRSAQTGGSHGLRECCELLIGVGADYPAIMEHRLSYSSQYQDYLQQRQALETETFNKG